MSTDIQKETPDRQVRARVLHYKIVRLSFARKRWVLAPGYQVGHSYSLNFENKEKTIEK
jgi:hypothetical protein